MAHPVLKNINSINKQQMNHVIRRVQLNQAHHLGLSIDRYRLLFLSETGRLQTPFIVLGPQLKKPLFIFDRFKQRGRERPLSLYSAEFPALIPKDQGEVWKERIILLLADLIQLLSKVIKSDWSQYLQDFVLSSRECMYIA